MGQTKSKNGSRALLGISEPNDEQVKADIQFFSFSSRVLINQEREAISRINMGDGKSKEKVFHSTSKTNTYSGMKQVDSALVPSDNQVDHDHHVEKKEFDENVITKLVYKDEVDEIPVDVILENYPKLVHLILKENDIEEIPLNISKLCSIESLKILYWQQNDTHSIQSPGGLDKLTSLTSLSLNENCITELPSALTSLINLTDLDLSENQLSDIDITPAFKYLTDLDVSNNQIGELPQNFGNLIQLKFLNISNNELKQLPDSIGNLSKLEIFNASSNKLKYLPKSIGNLISLVELELEENKLKEIPLEIQKLTSLEDLDISSNRIVTLPLQMGLMPSLIYCNLSDNEDIQMPPQNVISQGEKIMFSFMREVLKSGSKSYVRTKLILLGDGFAGKTTLHNRLKSGMTQTVNSTTVTDAIAIDEWTIERDQKVTLTTFDFAGQKVYHSMHPFFLSNKAIYLVLYNLRSGGSNLEYWLYSIKIRAPDADIFVVGTNVDQVQTSDIPESLKDKFPQIKAFFKVSSITNEGIEELIDKIYETAITNDEELQYVVPNSYMKLKEFVEEKANQLPYTDWKNFVKMIDFFDDENELKRACTLLHDQWGVMMCFFQNININLQNLVILKPQWLSNMISTLVSAKPSSKLLNGIISHDDLNEIWGSEVPDKSARHGLISLMHQFEIAYLCGLRTSLIVPMVPNDPNISLQEIQEQMMKSPHILEYVYNFEFIPIDFFTRVIVRLNKFCSTDPTSIWKTGLFLEKNDSKALVLLDKQLGTFSIRVSGPYPQNLLSICYSVVETLLCEFKSINFETFVTCPHCIILEHANSNPLSAKKFQPFKSIGKFPLKKCLEVYDSNRSKQLMCTHCEQKCYVEDLVYYSSRNEVIAAAIRSSLHQGETGNQKQKQEIAQDKKEFLHRQFLSNAKMKLGAYPVLFLPVLPPLKEQHDMTDEEYSDYSEDENNLQPLSQDNIEIKMQDDADMLLVFSLCECCGYWHFVDEYYELKIDDFSQIQEDQLQEFQQQLRFLIKILENMGEPDNFPPKNCPYSNWKDFLSSVKTVSHFSTAKFALMGPNDLYGKEDSTGPEINNLGTSGFSPANMPSSNPIHENREKRKKKSWYEVIMTRSKTESGESSLRLMPVPTSVHPLSLCEEHASWFESQDGEEQSNCINSAYELKKSSITIEKNIGRGAYGLVYLARLFNQIRVAVKTINLNTGIFDDDIDKDLLELSMKEMTLLRKLNHPNIVLYIGAYLGNNKNLCIVLEYVGGGDLSHFIHVKCKMDSNQKAKQQLKLKFAKDIARGMLYLHQSGIVHRDLKPDNVLIAENLVNKVSDFGISRAVQEKDIKSTLGTRSQLGTFEYMAPEVFKEEKQTYKVDVYSYGVLLWEMFTETKPWSGTNPYRIPTLVMSSQRPTTPHNEILKKIPHDIHRIIQKCWQDDALDRPDFKQIIEMLEKVTLS